MTDYTPAEVQKLRLTAMSLVTRQVLGASNDEDLTTRLEPARELLDSGDTQRIGGLVDQSTFIAALAVQVCAQVTRMPPSDVLQQLALALAKNPPKA